MFIMTTSRYSCHRALKTMMSTCVKATAMLARTVYLWIRFLIGSLWAGEGQSASFSLQTPPKDLYLGIWCVNIVESNVSLFYNFSTNVH